MKSFFLWFSSLITFLAIPQITEAQNDDESNNVNVDVLEIDVVGNNNQTVDQSIIAIMTENAPEQYQDPKLPRFAIVGKDKKYYLGIGGYVRGTVSFDWGNPIENPTYFKTADIYKQSKGNGAQSQMSAGTTNLFFNFVTLPGHKNQVGTYINFNFDNDQYDIDLRHAYLTWRNFMAGYSYTTFYDQNCVPMTVDFEGAPSLTSIRTSLFGWNATCHNWAMGIALESPIFSATENDSAYIVNQRMPSIPMYIKYNWTENSYTRLGVLFRSVQYRNVVKNKNRARFGYGFQLTGIQEINKMFKIYYQGLYGDGISDYLIDLNGMYLDVVPDLNNPGKLKGTQVFAFLGGLKITYSKRLCSNHLFSQVRSFIKRYNAENPATASLYSTSYTLPWDDQYKYAQYLCNNVFYNYGALQVGLEYLWGARRNMNKRFAHDNRLQFMVQINF